MENPMLISLPYPVSVNHYWRSVPMGKRFAVLISQAGRKYRETVCRIVATQKMLT